MSRGETILQAPERESKLDAKTAVTADSGRVSGPGTRRARTAAASTPCARAPDAGSTTDARRLPASGARAGSSAATAPPPGTCQSRSPPIAAAARAASIATADARRSGGTSAQIAGPGGTMFPARGRIQFTCRSQQTTNSVLLTYCLEGLNISYVHARMVVLTRPGHCPAEPSSCRRRRGPSPEHGVGAGQR